MRFCIVGAGAIGGLLGARLALAGEDVTFIARGENLEAINERGIRVLSADREALVSNLRGVARFEDAGQFDVVVVTVKAHQLGEVAARIESLCHAETAVIPMQNGIPFWYFSGHGGVHSGRAIESVDPGGHIRDAIPARRIIGCVVFVAAQREGPGAVRHNPGFDRFPMGELDGKHTDRIARIAQAFEHAGFKVPILDDIRAEVWLKLWGNASFNPISALTHAALSDICHDGPGRDLAARVMRETQQVAEKFGIAFRVSIDQRIDSAARVGRHKTSMLQDVEAGRALEIDALVGSVVEMGALVGVETPTIRALYQAVKLLDRTLRAERVSVRAMPLSGS